MDIFSVTCPSCGREYYADMLLYSLPVELHCPYCGVYFYKENSPLVITGSASSAAVAKVPGGLKKETIYRPGEEKS
ncbi:MAG: hypothetical protein KMY53_04350 [Desulfarculus sp.]|nr:hypothetical protein [Pseudomonadota bacterium]MBV1718106.1 hypothetical protein [Desulfarculus sp.]MBU4573004.1 hypothetical protein [Pseudomonadota bacterium]MBU4597497.1 hypothetical protein [Pseudomonadota bacterium]MBV1737373.1 hypothetical protein [Desulfarculus sp.]